jgi:hypothetical protein
VKGVTGEQMVSIMTALQRLSGRTSSNIFVNILPADVAARRATLIDIIWSGNGYPSTGVDSIESDVTDPLSSSASNLLRVDKLTINMDDNDGNFVMSCTPRIWYPAVEDANGKLVVLHYGHNGAAPSPDENWNADTSYIATINALIEAGYTVIGVQMSGGTATHNTYPDPTATLHYMKFLLEPVVRVINEYASGFDALYMVGKSGGGWTTVLMAAIDTRIKRSIEVAGTYPLTTPETSRDWEQLLPGIQTKLVAGTSPRLLDYQDFYMMALDGGRRQLQLHNVNDSCCFDLAGYEAGYDYAPALTTLAGSYGGTWTQVWDDTHSDHIISALGRSLMLEFFSAV